VARQMRKSRANGFLVRPDRFIYCSDRDITADDYQRVAAVVGGARLATYA
jgi:3-(3-hydroxy-phenyl)propionate hydroxylase